ncbi:MAG: DUF4255 domain-containing protein, partial [Chitinophagaceae bacterium]
MIFQAIDCIQKQLNPAIVNAVAGNISEILTAGGSNPINDADVIISVINIEENRMSRDPRNYVHSGTNIFSKNPAVHLNLTLLFTALRSEAAYGPALQNLQRVIQFFQGKYVFDHINTPILDPGIEKLILEMVTMNLEQLNHLWAILGSRYQPS